MKPSILLLPAVALLSTTACDRRPNPDDELVIGFSQCCEDAYREAVLSEMRIEATNYPGMRIVYRNADYDNTLQEQQVSEMIRPGHAVDVLILSPNEADPLTPVAERAYRTGIPTIILDRKINSDRYSVAIGADNYEIGRAVGRYARQLLPEGSRILEIWGIPGSTPAVERHNGFLSSLGDGYRVDSVRGEWQREVAEARIARMADYEGIDCIFAHNDVMALAAREAIMRRDTAAARRIRFLGIDATYGEGLGLEAVAAGALDASFIYPTGGLQAIRAAMALHRGEPVAKNIRLETAVIDQTNAGTLLAQMSQMIDYQRRIDSQRHELESLTLRLDKLLDSWIGVLCIILVLVPTLLYALRANRKIHRRNIALHESSRKIELQRQELEWKNAQLERAAANKMRFFTNVSHEIRTPVTLIINPLRKLLGQCGEGGGDPALRESLSLVERNAERLLKMVNRILDVSRMEDNSSVLILRDVGFAEFVREIGACFIPTAQARGIRFSFEDTTGNTCLTIDPDKIELVVMNLLANAFRFTPDGGEVKVRVSCDARSLRYEVEDSGCGIPAERLGRIFDRFVTDPSNPGTGVGLALCREIAELHHARLTGENRPEGGARFTLQLLAGRSHYADRETLEESSTAPADYTSTDMPDDPQIESRLRERRPEKILLVEDHTEVRRYLQRELARNFCVETASEGDDALRILRMDTKIQLVVSDVMMPGTDGFRLVEAIRRDQRLSHLPVVLLTALTGEHDQMKGMARGADVYVQKPFNIDLLRLQLFNLLDDRRRMRQRLGSRVRQGDYLATQELNAIVGVDEKFRNRLLELLEERYADSEFSTVELSERLNLSRVHLYRKTKELFGAAPSELLRNFRLNKAVALLEARGHTISEVTYMTGFTSPSYFSKCFKALYGKTPTEHRE